MGLKLSRIATNGTIGSLGSFCIEGGLPIGAIGATGAIGSVGTIEPVGSVGPTGSIEPAKGVGNVVSIEDILSIVSVMGDWDCVPIVTDVPIVANGVDIRKLSTHAHPKFLFEFNTLVSGSLFSTCPGRSSEYCGHTPLLLPNLLQLGIYMGPIGK
ncbi:hypothetical protein [Halostagnicola sp. A-GB9-2]|uniref:hypothetical protein n=1 Tax=Halostagnicola sp. A-GB9-2 TaxID=3048066 RepID=UPI0024BF5FFA|nr:hypothetical protein [Halostagnicola sp. A-GB9-2]MDJ1434314.1 hypothetical protein [Halostagnicola sp. A-GB9-2]